MSYDLFLFPDGSFDQDDFVKFFKDRPGYSMPEDNDPTFFIYENELTGTYFSFQYIPKEDINPELIKEEGWPNANHIAFNMNYFRPHTFGLEAVEEVEAVVKELKCQVRDPQYEGMGTQWDREGFLRGWNWGNAFAYQAILGEVFKDLKRTHSLEEDLKTLASAIQTYFAPTREIEDVWKWNYNKDRLYDYVEEKYFISRVMWGALEDKKERPYEPVKTVVWGQGVPIIIPEVATHVIVIVHPPGAGKKKRGLLGMLFGRKNEIDDMRHYLIELKEIKALDGQVSLEHLSHVGDVYDGAAIAIPHGPEALPQAFLEKLEAKWPNNQVQDRLTLLSWDHIRNKELVEEALKEMDNEKP